MQTDANAPQGVDPLDAAADQVIMACDGDVRAAVRADRCQRTPGGRIE